MNPPLWFLPTATLAAKLQGWGISLLPVLITISNSRLLSSMRIAIIYWLASNSLLSCLSNYLFIYIIYSKHHLHSWTKTLRYHSFAAKTIAKNMAASYYIFTISSRPTQRAAFIRQTEKKQSGEQCSRYANAKSLLYPFREKKVLYQIDNSSEDSYQI